MSKYPGRIVSNLAPTGYSVYFDGTGDFLTAGSNAAYNIDSGSTDSFVCEGWFYWNVVQASVSLVDNGGLTGSSFANWAILLNASSQIEIGWGNSGAPGNSIGSLPTSIVPTVGTWFHIALVKTNADWACFVNGVRRANFNGLNTAAKSSANPLRIADGITSQNSGNRLNGYVSNVRIYKGATANAPYSATSTTITVPTQLFRITNTQLLTCQSPTILDNSANNFTVIANGNAVVSTLTPFTPYVPYNPALGASTPGMWTVDEAMQAAATRQWNMYDPAFNLTTLLLHGNPTNGTSFITDASANRFTVTPGGDVRAANLSPFSLTTFATSGSGYFDGTGDFVSLVYDTVFNFGTGDFTVEAWLFCTLFANSSIVDNRASAGASPWAVYINASGQPYLYDGTSYTSSIAITLNAWTHVAVARQSGTLRIFVNGVQGLSTSLTGSLDRSAGNTMKIGINTAGSADAFNGYISNVRIVKGVAVYTGAFTTPTAPLTATQAAGTNISAITGTQTSLLTLQNSQSANNNAFLDSSSNNFLITRNGNTTQGSFSPFSQTGWSVNHGVNNYWQAPTSTNWDIFGGAFTVEMWVYLTSFTTDVNQGVFFIGNYTGSGGGSGWSVGASSGASPVLNIGYWNGAGGTNLNSTGVIPLNAWTHIAVTRSGSTIFFYINGVSVGSGAAPSVGAGDKLTSGAYVQNFTYPSWVYGSISNLRIIKGTALYSGTGSFTPPTGPLTAVANTVFLGNQSNRFIDNGPNAVTITPSGTLATQPFSPFYPTAAYTPQTIGGSGYFDGTGDYLTLADNAAFDLGTGDFTFECWVYKPDNSEVSFLCSGATGLDFAYVTAGGDTLRIGRYPVAWDAQVSYSIPRNAWTHIAFIKASGRSYFFANGVLLNAGGTANTNTYDTTTTLNVAVAGDGTRRLTGYMTGVRLVKGQALATASFTPPTSPVTATSVGWTGAASSITGTVSLLLNFTNAGVVDSTGDNVLETVADTRISTAVSRFGGSSIFMDGTGDYLQVAPNPLFDLKTSDFTVEFWIYPTSFASATYPMYSQFNRSTTNAFAIEVSTGGVVFVYVTNAGGAAWSIINGGNIGTLTLNTWNHVAFVRNGTAFRGYVNGVQGALSTNSANTIETFNGFNIGAVGAGTSGYFTGYFDEYRISRFARYTGNFTPQTSQWQDQ